jgi:hypothetical protein
LIRFRNTSGRPRLDEAAAFRNLAEFDGRKAKAFGKSRSGLRAVKVGMDLGLAPRPLWGRAAARARATQCESCEAKDLTRAPGKEPLERPMRREATPEWRLRQKSVARMAFSMTTEKIEFQSATQGAEHSVK